MKGGPKSSLRPFLHQALQIVKKSNSSKHNYILKFIEFLTVDVVMLAAATLVRNVQNMFSGNTCNYASYGYFIFIILQCLQVINMPPCNL